MNLNQITPVILTFNEGANLDRTLQALISFPVVIVLDSGSTDQTEAICSTFPNVHWHQRPFDSHAAQWNVGLQLIQTPWALTLDADYFLSEKLLAEILALPDDPTVNGFYIPFIYQIHGQSLHRSLLPPRLALFEKAQGTYVQDGHTQDCRLNGEHATLQNPFFHDDRKPFSRWWAAQEKYTDLEIEKLTTTSWAELKIQDRLRKCIFIAPIAVLFYNLLYHRSFLDGRAGLIYTVQRFLAEALLSFKLLLAWLRA